ncbi:MAG: hypothetical protein ACREE9_19225 [Stellaceae bacterium]
MIIATKWVVAAGALMFASPIAYAGGPVSLTDGQLDQVTAGQGGPFAEVAAGATAAGLFTTGNTQTIATTGVADSPFDGSNAMASGVAFGVGSNGVSPGSSDANVSTFTEAPGNFVVNYASNRTIYGAGGATLQVGISVSVGDLVPGLP